MVALSVNFPQLTALLRVHAAGAMAGKPGAVVGIPALPAACLALGAIVRRHRPLKQEPSSHAPDVVVARRKTKNWHNGETAGRRDNP